MKTKLTKKEATAIELMLETFLGDPCMDMVYALADDSGFDGDEIINTLYLLGGVDTQDS